MKLKWLLTKKALGLNSLKKNLLILSVSFWKIIEKIPLIPQHSFLIFFLNNLYQLVIFINLIRIPYEVSFSLVDYNFEVAITSIVVITLQILL